MNNQELKGIRARLIIIIMVTNVTIVFKKLGSESCAVLSPPAVTNVPPEDALEGL